MKTKTDKQTEVRKAATWETVKAVRELIRAAAPELYGGKAKQPATAAEIEADDHITKILDEDYGNLQDAFFKAHAQTQVLREFTESIGQTDETMMTVNLCLESILEQMDSMRKIFGNQ